MDCRKWIGALAFCAALILPTAAIAAKSYQVTGPVLELTDKNIVVQKDTEKWEIARDPETKVTGDLKVGAKVTVHYVMSAKEIEVKPEKEAAAKPPAATEAKASPTPKKK